MQPASVAAEPAEPAEPADPAAPAVEPAEPTSARGGRWSRLARRPGLWLLLVIASGAALRLVGLGWGLPLQLHPDEWVVVRGAIDMAERNSFEPSQFSRPDHLEIQLSYVAYQLYGHLLHGTPPELLYATSPAPFYFLSRLVTAILGTLCIPVAYLIGRRFGALVGLVAAAAVAFHAPFVTNSHYATPDVPLVLTSLLVVLACLEYLARPSWRWLLLACAAVALGVTAKYPAAVGGGVVALTVVVAAFQSRSWRRGAAHLLAAPVAFVGAVFVLSPVLVTNFTAVRAQLTGQNSTGHLGADGLGFFGNLRFYASDTFSYVGVLGTALAVLGLVHLLRTRDWRALPLGLGALMWVALSVLALHWSRWGLPIHITVLLLAAVGAGALPGLLRAWRPRVAVPATAVVVGLALGNLAVTAASSVAGLLIPDTRTVALKHFEAAGISPSNTIYEGYTPHLPGAPLRFHDSFEVVDGELEVSPTDERHGQARYAVVSSGMYGRFQREAKYAREQEIYRLLDEQADEIGAWHSGGADAVVMPVEIVNIPRQLTHVVRSALGDTMSGPTIKLYELPR